MAKNYLNDFVLVGRTNLALQIGHRHSIDLDFFSNKEFKAEELDKTLRKDFEMKEPQVVTGSTLIVEAEGVKLDFIRFIYLFAHPFLRVDELVLLDMRDIAPMKIDAITGRGRKKDFYDLFFLLQRFGLNEMMEWYDRMFHKMTVFHVWKSLTYFDDAEKDADPLVFDSSVTWPRVKEAIRNEVRKL
ncbi:MAG TPA: nucleotidyl transferase AbiEii/AbiGii toxin family protein [Saprospiraceae bacterium]|nr:nucleotidyl transferase AbiEii/AbiGii toxin family protein [Saprospiraceae bacterium]